jgi:hypothetical protein
MLEHLAPFFPDALESIQAIVLHLLGKKLDTLWFPSLAKGRMRPTSDGPSEQRFVES